jgi:hypothetical protein
LGNYCGVKIAGFFIVPDSGSKAKNELGSFICDADGGIADNDLEEAYEKLKKDGVYLSGADGYDEHFVIRGGSKLHTEEESILEGIADDAKISQIRSAFKKGSKKKIKSRVLLTKFIDLIA